MFTLVLIYLELTMTGEDRLQRYNKIFIFTNIL
nr:MAG TPA: hypothetical protein [Caudoviricetes sp.]